MSLNIDIQINGRSIGLIEIMRIDGSTNTTPDTVNEYRWSYMRGVENLAVGHISHRYGDDAIALAHKVLGEIAERQYLAAKLLSEM